MQASQPDTASPEVSTPKLIHAGPFIALAGIGATVASVLIYHHVELTGGFQVSPSACAIGEHFDCDKVARSAYAELFGIPIASFALWFYLAFLTFSIAARQEIRRGNLRVLTALLSVCVSSLVPTIFLLFVSIVQVRSLCMYCLLLDCTNIALTIVSLRALSWKNIGSGMVNGIKELGTFFICMPWSSKPIANSARGAAMGLVISGAVILLAPHYLVKEYFQPRQNERTKFEDAFLNTWLEKWENAPTTATALVENGGGIQGDFSQGNLAAQISVVEFADFQCSFCMKASKVVHQLVEKYGDRVRFVYKNYPLDSSCNPGMTVTKHEFGCRAAIMARCAGEQGSQFFWDMHDALFDLPLWTAYALDALPEQIGLDTPRFKSCIESEEVKNRIRADITQAASRRINATPTFFIVQNGKELQAPAFPLLDRLLSRLLESPPSAKRQTAVQDALIQR